MFDFLQSESVLDIILSAEVVFCAIFTLSMFIAVHALLTFIRQSNGLHTRLAQIEGELNVLQASIPGKLERMRDMRRHLEPLKQEFQRVQAYYTRLQHIERRWEEAQSQAEREAQTANEKTIERRRLGLDRFL